MSAINDRTDCLVRTDRDEGLVERSNFNRTGSIYRLSPITSGSLVHLLAYILLNICIVADPVATLSI